MVSGRMMPMTEMKKERKARYMKQYIVTWIGSCQIEAEDLAEAIDNMKKMQDLVVTCSNFKATEEKEN